MKEPSILSAPEISDQPHDSATIAAPGASRLGLALFAIYTLLYLGFVFINAFSADTMEMVVFAGLNLAIIYGFGLIIAAILLAFVYGFALRGTGTDSTDKASNGTGESA
ncbi:Protein of unknown function, DUF485 [Neorhodopirellula lusitana]|uniref:DUF485 domain-containing protein n=1 Tax=Neorhodopirellula lusitana TaxID=445327 RepID=A0ABY1PVQ6_9BACT|nr:DUF485 domain-containing protein [Neorhodopirellula lusitana]SMP46634.1 Protein of unknown function, DUF485 [Neorhodopirellula lusitana]